MEFKSNPPTYDAGILAEAILNSSTDNIVLISPNYRVLSFNKATKETIYGLFKKEISEGLDYREFIVPDLYETFSTAFEEALKGIVTEVELETKVEHFCLWFFYKMNPVYDASKQLIGVTLTTRNIDSDKRSRLTLKEQSKLYEAVLENNPESLLVLDKSGKILRFNQVIRDRMFAQTGKELRVGGDIREFMLPSHNSGFFELFESALLGNVKNADFEVVQTDGSKNWFNSSTFPVFGHEGEVLGVSIINQNITNRKKAELELRKNEIKFRKIIESASNPIIIADDQLKIQLVNPEVLTLFGYTQNELMNASVEILIPGCMELMAQQKKTKQFEQIKTIRIGIENQVEAKTKNGNAVFIEGSLNMFQLDDEKFNLIVIQDITHRIHHENKLRKSNRELDLLNGINDIILNHDQKAGLYENVCEALVNQSLYQLAWIGEHPAPDDQKQIIKPIAAAGKTDYLNTLQISLLDEKHSKGPTVTATLTDEIVVTNSLPNAEAFKPWLANASKYGFTSSIALPIKIENGPNATLNIYSNQSNAFDTDEISILERVSRNISLALKQDRIEQEKDQMMHDLNERVKELRTIYHVSSILQNIHQEFDQSLQKIVEIMPTGWQYPDICAARITFNGRTYQSAKYVKSVYRQSVPFLTFDKKRGEIEVVYLVEKKRPFDEPFLEEEQNLINQIADLIISSYNKKEIFEELVRSQSNLITVFDNTDVGYMLLDANLEIIALNEPFREEYAKDACIQVEIGINYASVLLRQKKAKNLSHLDKVFSRGQTKSHEIAYRIGEKERVYFLTMIPIKDESEQVIGVCMSAQDITSRKQEEALLKAQKHQLSEIVKLNTQIIETADQFFYVTTINQSNPEEIHLTYLSPQIEKILGCQIVNIFHRQDGWHEFIHGSDLSRLSATVKNLVENKQPVRISYRINFGQLGHYRWVEEYICPLLDASGNIIELYGSVRDIDEQENTLRKLQEEQIHSYEFQSKLLSSQLNPHFVYNTLNGFQYSILHGNVEDSLSQIADFSTLMRQVLENSTHPLISLREEIAFLTLYVSISKLRLQKGLQFEIITDGLEDKEEWQIPPMLLQPYVENAMIHGLTPSQKPAELTIRFQRDADFLVCSIRDNGVGRTNSPEPDIRKKRTSYAMHINQDRIAILNQITDNEFSLEVIDHLDEHQAPSGTEVLIRYKIIDDEVTPYQ